MKDWILNFLAGLILSSIKDEKIEQLAHQIQEVFIPLLREQKATLIERLKLKAAETGTELDDAMVHALDVFLESFIPRDAQCLAEVKRAS